MALVVVFSIPETAYWLYTKNRIDEARKSVQWLRGCVNFSQIEREFHEFYWISAVKNVKAEKKIKGLKQKFNTSRLTSFTKRNLVSPFLPVIFFFTIEHFSDVTALQTFAIQILSSFSISISISLFSSIYWLFHWYDTSTITWKKANCIYLYLLLDVEYVLALFLRITACQMCQYHHVNRKSNLIH